MTERGHPANEMGPELLAHVERELLLDLRHYGVSTEGFSFDWSNPCQEGHRTEFLDGHLEEMSDVRVIDRIGRPQAQGWIDFVHGAPDAPLVVFWLYLRVWAGDSWRRLRDEPTLPVHVWRSLPDRSKELCATQGKYDARWSKDPLVTAWRTQRRQG